MLIVVICLKNRTFAVSQTTAVLYSEYRGWLWFAWKIVLLQYRKQLLGNQIGKSLSCDLLEKSYFCSIANNCPSFWLKTCVVVICLKNRTFAVSQTTKTKKYEHLPRCDLLEKSYFCSIANNVPRGKREEFIVVICLKNRTFAVSQTTLLMGFLYKVWLWFAWKIVLLQYRKQQCRKCNRFDEGCDLLEKSYFCSIANNSGTRVVTGFRLWFAWKIVLLQYRKQHSKAYSLTMLVVICLKNRTFAVSQTTHH